MLCENCGERIARRGGEWVHLPDLAEKCSLYAFPKMPNLEERPVCGSDRTVPHDFERSVDARVTGGFRLVCRACGYDSSKWTW